MEQHELPGVGLPSNAEVEMEDLNLRLLETPLSLVKQEGSGTRETRLDPEKRAENDSDWKVMTSAYWPTASPDRGVKEEAWSNFHDQAEGDENFTSQEEHPGPIIVAVEGRVPDSHVPQIVPEQPQAVETEPQPVVADDEGSMSTPDAGRCAGDDAVQNDENLQETGAVAEELAGCTSPKTPQAEESEASQFNISNVDIFNKWWSIGSDRSLTTDNAIASFLIDLYENTESAVQSAARCVHCHTPLSLVCTKCQFIPRQASETESIPHAVVSETDSEDDSEDDDKTDKDDEDYIPDEDDDEDFVPRSGGRVTDPAGQADAWDSLMSTTFSKAGSPKEKPLVTRGTKVRASTQRVSGTGASASATPSPSGEEISPETLSKKGSPKSRKSSRKPGDASPPKTKIDDGKIRKHICGICWKAFTRAPHLKRHQIIHTGERPYGCIKCTARFTRFFHLKRHFERTHPNDIFEPASDDKESDEKKLRTGNNEEKLDISEEMDDNTGNTSKKTDGKSSKQKEQVCKVCNATFKRVFHLKRHMRVHSGERPYICSVCGMAYKDATSLKNHELNHLREKMGLEKVSARSAAALEKEKSCEPCEKGEEEESTCELEGLPPRKPSADKSRGKIHVCDVCGKAFARPFHLKRHKIIHIGGVERESMRKHTCSVCNASFLRSYHLTRHKKIHTGERPYVCVACGQSFVRAYALKMHELIHSRPPKEKPPKKPRVKPEGKPFICDLCGSGYRSSTDLKIHRRIHTGEKPYLCNYCGRAFHSAGEMRRHERLHTGVRPHKCSECNASFTRRGDLRRHFRCHAGQKSYFCRECGAGFTTFAFLRMHKRTHAEDMPYVCGLCNAAFCTAPSLKRHAQSNHGDNSSPLPGVVY